MKEIFQFSSINNRSLSIERKQSTPDEVIIRVECDGDEYLLPFQRGEFNELCNLRYRLEFPLADLNSL
jgi:hypothetical protein